MNFLIADSFPSAMRKLTAQEQKAVKTTVFDLQIDPSHPGLQFHRIDASKDANFWSVRVNRDIRLIIHKTQKSVLVCYVDHHDDAYKWAERRRIDTHPRTGAAQIVEVRERVEEILVHKPVEVGDETPELPKLFPSIGDDELLDYGVPEDWLESVKAANEDSLFELTDHLPAEASEALLELAVGELPQVSRQAQAAPNDPFSHPDALRRFRVMENVDELKVALDYPWEQWTVFLHPSQEAVVKKKFTGPARVTGSAGTGKSVVAIHRVAALLDSEPDAQVLLTTFSLPLANSLENKLRVLRRDEARVVPRVTILPFKGVAKELFTLAFGHDPRVAREDQVQAILDAAADELGVDEFTSQFIHSEWSRVVDAWQIAAIEEYSKVARLGRKNRMGTKQRERIWPIFELAKAKLQKQGILTWSEIFRRVTNHYAGQERKPFTHAVVDEAQDLGIPELRMLSAIVPGNGDALFFAGDLGQRIFQEPFSWKSLGVDVVGRSNTLKVNYRTSHQIRRSADRLLPQTVRDVDGDEQDRRGTVSVFNGPEPTVEICDSTERERDKVSAWIRMAVQEGIEPSEIGVFVRSNAELERARLICRAANLPIMELSERYEEAGGRVSVGTMHLAKGLEFKVVVVMACDDDVLPLQGRIDDVSDEAELEDVFETERHLFYVACTRARDRLLVSGVSPVSEFLDDFM